MSQEKQSREEMLVDWHLDQLDETERSWIDAELSRDADLRVQHERLGKVLRPLESWRADNTPPDLADRVLEHILCLPAVLSLSPETSGTGRRPFLARRDLIAIAASIALLFGVVIPGVSTVRAHSQRARCAENLGSIYRGLGAYQNDFAGSLPFAGTTSNVSWLPTADRRTKFASNSRHMYLLVKWNYGPQTEDFLCPGCDTGRRSPSKDATFHDDFSRTTDVSYASLNMNGTSPNLRPKKIKPYLADANPLFVGSRFDASVDPNTANSPAHGGKGQTVLMLDGRTEWLTTPLYGNNKDNLWLAGDIRNYTGKECASCQDDIHLVPGFPRTDPGIRQQIQDYRMSKKRRQ